MNTLRLTSALVVLLLVAGCGGAAPAPTAAPTAVVPATAVAPATASVTQAPTQAPTRAAEPTAAPTGEPSAAPATQQRVTLRVPAAGATVTSPVQVSGQVTVGPFEATLRARVYDAAGQVVGEGPIRVTTPAGEPGPFNGEVAFTVRAGGPGRIEVADISPKDGSAIAVASTAVTLAAPASGGAIEIPAANAKVTLPLHILARVGQPGEKMTAALTWADGTTLKQAVPVLAGETGGGLVAASIDWMNEGPPPMPATQGATLELWNQAGERVATQAVTVLNAQDAGTQAVTLYFVLGESLQPVQRTIPKTEGIGAAALDELLWGPNPNNLAGFETAIPTAEQVLSFPGRGPGWGARVTLKKLTIVDGVATADFSREINAYAGGSLRVKLLREQITQTLMQFPTVKQVVIAVEGQTEGVLQP